jgi:hypothetical protein
MLSGTSVKPPQLDEFFPGDPASKPSALVTLPSSA